VDLFHDEPFIGTNPKKSSDCFISRSALATSLSALALEAVETGRKYSDGIRLGAGLSLVAWLSGYQRRKAIGRLIYLKIV
jgi:hypothetical protein